MLNSITNYLEFPLIIKKGGTGITSWVGSRLRPGSNLMLFDKLFKGGNCKNCRYANISQIFKGLSKFEYVGGIWTNIVVGRQE